MEQANTYGAGASAARPVPYAPGAGTYPLATNFGPSTLAPNTLPQAPAPQQAWPVVPNAPAGPRPKRVGTLTLAACLIAAGLVLLLGSLLPIRNFAFVARLAPLALISFGAEILYCNIFVKDRPLQYDFFCIVACGFALLLGIAAY